MMKKRKWLDQSWCYKYFTMFIIRYFITLLTLSFNFYVDSHLSVLRLYKKDFPLGKGYTCINNQWVVPNLLCCLLRHLLMHTSMNMLMRYRFCFPNIYLVISNRGTSNSFYFWFFSLLHHNCISVNYFR